MIYRRRYLIPVLLLLCGFFPAITPAQAQQPTFRIGVFGEANSSIGRGARLIADQLNAEGGVTGADGTQFRLELIFTSMEDSGAAISQLGAAGIVAAIGPSTTAEVGAISPQIPALNVPILTAATDDSLLINDPTGFLFRARASNFFTERALADYLFTNARLTTVDVIQFDVDATINVLGFTSAFQSVGGTPTTPVLVNTPDLLNSTAENIIARNPLGVVTYGDPARAGEFYVQLRTAGYTGIFAHPQANTPAFRGEFPPEVTAGIVSSTTWTVGAGDAASTNFIASYVRTYSQIPDSVASAGADAMTLLAEAIGLPGELRVNLTTLQGLPGIQGALAPAGRTTGELSDNTFVVQLNEFGSPVVQERFTGTTRVPVLNAQSVEDALLPTATPLPDGVFVR
ncbi:MAG: ABC transporter substrate-binding protein, partial [Chloroflexota bacterium]